MNPLFLAGAACALATESLQPADSAGGPVDGADGVAVGAAAGVATSAAAPELGAPERLAADGAPILVDIGHAAPYLYDLDGDGRRDLLVGQFGEGKLRFYRNVGEDGAPVYGAHEWVEADGRPMTVPAG